MSFAAYQKSPLSSLLAIATASTRLSETSFTNDMIEECFYPSIVIEMEGFSFAVSLSGNDESFFINLYNGNQGQEITRENMDSKSLAFIKGDYVRSKVEYVDLIERWANFPSDKESIAVIQMIAKSLYAVQERIRSISNH